MQAFSIAAFLGHSWCRFFCDVSHQEIGSQELTDGVWVWPEGLSHYVRAHGIILPEEFVEHSLSQKIPQAHPEIAPVDLDYWCSWCAARRSPAFLERLRSARAEANKAAEQGLKDWAAQKAAEHGLSDRECLWEGCAQLALKGTYICAKHSLGDTGLVTARFYDPSSLVRSFEDKA